MIILLCLIAVVVSGAVAWYALDRECDSDPDTNPNWPFPKDRP